MRRGGAVAASARGRTVGRLALGAAAFALLHAGCNQAILTAPTGATLRLFANPGFIAASGGVSVVSALVIEPAGTPVPDGTVVQFFTTLGVIDEQGRTNDGVARVNLVADSRSGTAQISAFSGAATSDAPVEVVIGSGLPETMVLTADPVRIAGPGVSFSRIVANVFDANGNAVVNVPVIFSVATGTGSALRVRMESGGAQRFTDNNGRVEDDLVVDAGLGGAQETVTVTATAADGVTATVQVTVN